MQKNYKENHLKSYAVKSINSKGRFYKEEARDIQGQLSKADKAEETSRLVNAASDAFTVFTLGGGGEAFKAGAKGAEGASAWSKFKAGTSAASKAETSGGKIFQNLLSNYGIEKGKLKATKEVASNITEGYMGSEIEDGFSNMMLQRAQKQLEEKIAGLAPESDDNMFYPTLNFKKAE